MLFPSDLELRIIVAGFPISMTLKKEYRWSSAILHGEKKGYSWLISITPLLKSTTESQGPGNPPAYPLALSPVT
jgi:hypothetical protein